MAQHEMISEIIKFLNISLKLENEHVTIHNWFSNFYFYSNSPNYFGAIISCAHLASCCNISPATDPFDSIRHLEQIGPFTPQREDIQLHLDWAVETVLQQKGTKVRIVELEEYVKRFQIAPYPLILLAIAIFKK